MVRVLVVDDDPTVREVVAGYLSRAGLTVDEAADGMDALARARHTPPDLVVLDLMLPGLDGLEVLRRLRAERGNLPVVLLTARGEESDRVLGLEVGADDYVTKPFGVDELLARLRAALRHGVQARGSQPIVRTGDLEIDLGLRRVSRGGDVVRLSPKEYDLLVELALNLGRPVSHADLLRAVWGSETADIQYLRVYIGQIRQKLEHDPAAPTLLTSEPGVGYRLEVLG